jgi:hypothetical protein
MAASNESEMSNRMKTATIVENGGSWQIAEADLKLGLAQFSLPAPSTKYSDRVDLSPSHKPIYEHLTLTRRASPFYNPDGLFGTGATQPTHAAFLAGAR